MTPQYIHINEFGRKFYYKDKAMTIRHREDGPAFEWGNDSKSWYLNDERLTEREFLLKTAKETILTMDEIAAKFGIEVSKLKIAK